MKQEINKRVAELLGECWHEFTMKKDSRGFECKIKCKKCGYWWSPMTNSNNKNYAENIADAWEMENEIYKQDKQNLYASFLLEVIFDGSRDKIINGELNKYYAICHATPKQRCLAFIKVMDE